MWTKDWTKESQAKNPHIEKFENRKPLAEKAAVTNKVEVNLEKIAGMDKEADMEIGEELDDKSSIVLTLNSQEEGSYWIQSQCRGCTSRRKSSQIFWKNETGQWKSLKNNYMEDKANDEKASIGLK